MHAPFLISDKLVVLLWCVLPAVVLAAGCNSREDKGAETFAPDQPLVVADYRVWASEGDSMATCMFQFFSDPQKRQSLWLDEPASVAIDQVMLSGDSARITGAFYEHQQSLRDFAGRHAITFRQSDGRVHRDSFFFPVVTLVSPFPEKMPAADTKLVMAGVPDGTRLRVVLTDTAFAGREYNELHTVQGQSIKIEKASLDRLHRGPVVMHLAAEEDRTLNGDLAGTLSVTYSLTRSFLLQ